MNIGGWWNSIPAKNREPLKSWFVSGTLSLQPTTVIALGMGANFKLYDPTNFGETMHFLGQCAWGIFMASYFAVGPFYRGVQGHAAAQTVVTTPPDPTLKTLPGP